MSSRAPHLHALPPSSSAALTSVANCQSLAEYSLARSPSKHKGPHRDGFTIEKCRDVLIRHCSWIPRNYTFRDGVNKVYVTLREYLGDENMDLAIAQLQELIEIPSEWPHDEGAAFQSWRHDFMCRHEDFDNAHVPSLGNVIVAPVMPTGRLKKWRADHPEGRKVSLPSPQSLEIVSTEIETQPVPPKYGIGIGLRGTDGNSLFASSAETGTKQLSIPTAQELHMEVWNTDFGHGGILGREHTIYPEDVIGPSDSPHSNNLPLKKSLAYILHPMRSFSKLRSPRRMKSFPFELPAIIRRSIPPNFESQKKGEQLKNAETENENEVQKRCYSPDPLLGRFAPEVKAYEDDPAVRALPDPDTKEGKAYYSNIATRALPPVMTATPRFARKHGLADENLVMPNGNHIGIMPTADEVAVHKSFQEPGGRLYPNDLSSCKGPLTPELFKDGGLDYYWERTGPVSSSSRTGAKFSSDLRSFGDAAGSPVKELQPISKSNADSLAQNHLPSLGPAVFRRRYETCEDNIESPSGRSFQLPVRVPFLSRTLHARSVSRENSLCLGNLPCGEMPKCSTLVTESEASINGEGVRPITSQQICGQVYQIGYPTHVEEKTSTNSRRPDPQDITFREKKFSDVNWIGNPRSAQTVQVTQGQYLLVRQRELGLLTEASKQQLPPDLPSAESSVHPIQTAEKIACLAQSCKQADQESCQAVDTVFTELTNTTKAQVLPSTSTPVTPGAKPQENLLPTLKTRLKTPVLESVVNDLPDFNINTVCLWAPRQDLREFCSINNQHFNATNRPVDKELETLKENRLQDSPEISNNMSNPFSCHSRSHVRKSSFPLDYEIIYHDPDLAPLPPLTPAQLSYIPEPLLPLCYDPVRDGLKYGGIQYHSDGIYYYPDPLQHPPRTSSMVKANFQEEVANGRSLSAGESAIRLKSSTVTHPIVMSTETSQYNPNASSGIMGNFVSLEGNGLGLDAISEEVGASLPRGNWPRKFSLDPVQDLKNETEERSGNSFVRSGDAAENYNSRRQGPSARTQANRASDSSESAGNLDQIDMDDPNALSKFVDYLKRMHPEQYSKQSAHSTAVSQYIYEDARSADGEVDNSMDDDTFVELEDTKIVDLSSNDYHGMNTRNQFEVDFGKDRRGLDRSTTFTDFMKEIVSHEASTTTKPAKRGHLKNSYSESNALYIKRRPEPIQVDEPQPLGYQIHRSDSSPNISPTRGRTYCDPALALSRIPVRGRGLSRSAKYLDDVPERDEDNFKADRQVPKRSRSPLKKIFGENGWLSATAASKEQVNQKKPGLVNKIKLKMEEIGLKADLSPMKHALKGDSEKTLLAISLSPPKQAELYYDIELLICDSANTFLMHEYHGCRMSVDSLKKVTDFWKSKGRPQVIEFHYDQSTQRDLIVANQKTFRFYGPSANNPLQVHAMLYAWKTDAREMAIRTFSYPDSMIRKHIKDTFKILDFLGGHPIQYLALHQVQAKFVAWIKGARQQTDNESSTGLGRNNTRGPPNEMPTDLVINNPWHNVPVPLLGRSTQK